MKIQCSCGAKYAFDVQPEMLSKPVRFVCASCGLDSSAFVNGLIRQELAGTSGSTSLAPPIEAAAAPAMVSGQSEPAAPPAPPTPRVRIHSGGAKAWETAPAATDDRFCAKHPAQRSVNECLVCHKAMCSKCMELFGYVCSPLCRQKGELQGLEIPVFAGQKSVVEARKWRKVGWAAAAVCVLLITLLGALGWYEFFGSRPRVAFSIRFENAAYSGQSRLCGQDQIVFLHGGRLARHDLQTRKEIWSCQLIDPKEVERVVQETIKSLRALQDRLNNEAPDAAPVKIPPPDRLARNVERDMADSLQLRVAGQNVWVASPAKLTRYGWDDGKPAQEILLAEMADGLIERGDEWLLLGAEPGKQIITRINLATGQQRREEIAEPAALAMAAPRPGKPAVSAPRTQSAKATVGLPVGTAGRDAGKPLDPNKVADQASRLSVPGKIALPAVLSINRNQERALAEMGGTARSATTARPEPEISEQFSLIPAAEGSVQFAVRLLEARMVTRKAMKDAPKKSALEGAPTIAKTAEVANEILNEMQRERGGDTVTEDESRYHVTIRRPNAKDAPDWAGEVIGPPALFPLKTVDVLTAGKTLIVLDKRNKKLWEGTLSQPVRGGGAAMDEDEATQGLGPCVERGDTLYVFDQAVLSAFELKTGNARWRLPSVGIAGVFFDDEGMLYANTTTASPESLKYSKQIDVSQKTSASIVKADPRSGKILWATETSGAMSYLAGKFIYTVQFYRPDESDEENPYTPDTGFETPPYLRIRRINPKNGREMWEHFQQRAPLDVQFDRNSIQLVFKKEVQVLRFLSL